MIEQILPDVSRINPVLLSSGTYYVALNEKKKIIGCGGWTFERPGTVELEEGLAHIRHFSTHPNYIGCGVGSALYNHIKLIARTKGANRFECYSTINAEPFYNALGLKRIKAFNLDMGKGIAFPSILMKANI